MNPSRYTADVQSKTKSGQYTPISLLLCGFLAAWHPACFQTISTFDAWLARIEGILTPSTVPIINNEHDTQGASLEVLTKLALNDSAELSWSSHTRSGKMQSSLTLTFGWNTMQVCCFIGWSVVAAIEWFRSVFVCVKELRWRGDHIRSYICAIVQWWKKYLNNYLINYL